MDPERVPGRLTDCRHMAVAARLQMKEFSTTKNFSRLSAR
jgi:hypothetical protein